MSEDYHGLDDASDSGGSTAAPPERPTLISAEGRDKQVDASMVRYDAGKPVRVTIRGRETHDRDRSESP